MGDCCDRVARCVTPFGRTLSRIVVFIYRGSTCFCGIFSVFVFFASFFSKTVEPPSILAAGGGLVFFFFYPTGF